MLCLYSVLHVSSTPSSAKYHISYTITILRRLFMPPPGRPVAEAPIQSLSLRWLRGCRQARLTVQCVVSSTYLSVHPLPNYEHDILTMNESILMLIGTSGPCTRQGRETMMINFLGQARSSKVKDEGGMHEVEDIFLEALRRHHS